MTEQRNNWRSCHKAAPARRAPEYWPWLQRDALLHRGVDLSGHTVSGCADPAASCPAFALLLGREALGIRLVGGLSSLYCFPEGVTVAVPAFLLSAALLPLASSHEGSASRCLGPTGLNPGNS